MVFKSKIHQNKDWNIIFLPILTQNQMSLRAKSTKTRIETKNIIPVRIVANEFKSKIHQNKDWNLESKIVLKTLNCV